MATFEIRKRDVENTSMASLFRKNKTIVSENTAVTKPVISETSDNIYKIPTRKNINSNDNNDEKISGDDILIETDTDSRNQNNRKFVRQFIVSHEKNSLAYYVSKFHEEIIKRATAPINNISPLDHYSVEQFQKKFAKCRAEWNKMMETVMTAAKYMDQNYKSCEYFGQKERLLAEILNISLSFIIIGAETKIGEGIDNLTGSAIVIHQYNRIIDQTKISIAEKIEIFFDKLLIPGLESIKPSYENIMRLNDLHNSQLNEKSAIISRIENTKKIIKAQESDMKKADRETAREIKESLQENRKDLEKMEERLEKCDQNIIDSIEKKKQEKINIDTVLLGLFTTINFSYFMHSDWCPYIDHGFLEKN